MNRKEEKWAIFWCNLLNPIIFGEIEEDETHQFLIKIAKIEVVFPDGRVKKPHLSTLKRKLEKYQKDGFNGLARKRRADIRKPRKVLAEAIEKAIELKKEQPSRSPKTINYFLNELYGVMLPPSTLYYHLKNTGITKRKREQVNFITHEENNMLEEWRKSKDKRKKFIGHNVKYDYVLLRRNGIHLKSVFFDTMLAASECFGDLDFLNLGFLAEKILGKRIQSYREALGERHSPWDIPLSKLASHACKDAETTLELYTALLKDLNSKGLNGRFFDYTMSVCRILGDYEYNGVRVDSHKLVGLHDKLNDEMLKLRQSINTASGQEIDVNSREQVVNFLSASLNLPELSGSSASLDQALERLAISYPIPRLMVQYKRLVGQTQSMEAIIKSIKNEKVYPVFNQVKSKYGLITSKYPDIFDFQDSKDVSLCFERKIRGLFRDELSAIDRVQKFSGDDILKKDKSNGQRANVFMETHPITKGRENNRLFLSIITEAPDSKIMSHFLMERQNLFIIKRDMESRYKNLFHFLDKFKRASLESGFAQISGERKYLMGLKSPNLKKRQKALELALRWLVKY